MRNADVITAISAKIAARLTELSGKTIQPLTADDMGPNPVSDHMWPYVEALGADGMGAAGYFRGAGPADLPNVWTAMQHLGNYIRESLTDPGTVTVPDMVEDHYDLPAGSRPTPEEWQQAAEDWELNFIPAEFLPDGPEGARTDEKRSTSEFALYLAWTQDARDSWMNHQAAKFAPVDFVAQSTEPKGVLAERALAGWGALDASRNQFVRDALAAGVTKTRVHELTGLSRVTIDRILEV